MKIQQSLTAAAQAAVDAGQPPAGRIAAPPQGWAAMGIKFPEGGEGLYTFSARYPHTGGRVEYRPFLRYKEADGKGLEEAMKLLPSPVGSSIILEALMPQMVLDLVVVSSDDQWASASVVLGLPEEAAAARAALKAAL